MLTCPSAAAPEVHLEPEADMVGETIDGTLRQTNLPNESREYLLKT